jgi:flagellar biosynthetic protein FliR
MTISEEAVLLFLLALARTAAWVVTLPIIGGRSTAGSARTAMALGLALFVSTQPGLTGQDLPTTVPGLVVAVLAQVLIGLALGWITSVLMAAFETAGMLIDFTAGFTAGSVYDPMTGNMGATFSRFFQVAFALLLFVTPAHEVLVRGFVGSFEILPLSGSVSLRDTLPSTLASGVAALFLIAIQLAAPVLGALFLTEVALGLMARFVPAANVFIISLNVKALVSLTAVGLVLTFLPGYLQRLASSSVEMGGLLF